MRKSLLQCELWKTMDFLQILVSALYITQVLTKSRSKKYKSSSEEGSIENLLYYKDCKRTSKPEIQQRAPLRYEIPSTPPPPPPRQPECPFPKMCCALTCGNECGSNQPAKSFLERQMAPANNIQPPQFMQDMTKPQSGMEAVQPQIRQRRKKIQIQPNNMQPSIPTRREMSGLTKDRIKGLIAQDDDVKKILKELVRVTMQKVDLQDMINSNSEKSYDIVNTVRSGPTAITYLEDYDE